MKTAANPAEIERLTAEVAKLVSHKTSTAGAIDATLLAEISSFIV